MELTAWKHSVGREIPFQGHCRNAAGRMSGQGHRLGITKPGGGCNRHHGEEISRPLRWWTWCCQARGEGNGPHAHLSKDASSARKIWTKEGLIVPAQSDSRKSIFSMLSFSVCALAVMEGRKTFVDLSRGEHCYDLKSFSSSFPRGPH